MIDPVFILGFSILLVAVSLAVMLAVAIPAFQELGRAARSIEKLADTLNRELPPTLEALRLTGLEITDLTDDVSEGVKSASGVVKQLDQGVEGARKQAQKAQVATRSVFAGVKAAWKSFTRMPNSSTRRSPDRLPANTRAPMDLREIPRTNYSANVPQRRTYGEEVSESPAELAVPDNILPANHYEDED